MAGDDDVVRRAGEHLAHASRAPALPELHRVTLDDLDLGEGIECDLGCDYVAVDEQLDGWATPGLEGGREAMPSYVICDACKDSWERGDWDRLAEVAATSRHRCGPCVSQQRHRQGGTGIRPLGSSSRDRPIRAAT